MNEINNSDVKYNHHVQTSAPNGVKPESKQPSAGIEYKEAAAAPGAEAAGRAQIMIGKNAKIDNIDNIDNIDSDIEFLLNNPEIANVSDAWFIAAEKAGIPYPEAAIFATQEVR